MWPIWFVAEFDLAHMVYSVADIDFLRKKNVADMDVVDLVCGRIGFGRFGLPCGQYLLFWPICFVADMDGSRVDELDRELSAQGIVLGPGAQKPEKQIALLDAVDKEVAGRQGKLLATTLSPIKRTGSPTQDVFDLLDKMSNSLHAIYMCRRL